MNDNVFILILHPYYSWFEKKIIQVHGCHKVHQRNNIFSNCINIIFLFFVNSAIAPVSII